MNSNINLESLNKQIDKHIYTMESLAKLEQGKAIVYKKTYKTEYSQTDSKILDFLISCNQKSSWYAKPITFPVEYISRGLFYIFTGKRKLSTSKDFITNLELEKKKIKKTIEDISKQIKQLEYKNPEDKDLKELKEKITTLSKVFDDEKGKLKKLFTSTVAPKSPAATKTKEELDPVVKTDQLFSELLESIHSLSKNLDDQCKNWEKMRNALESKQESHLVGKEAKTEKPYASSPANLKRVSKAIPKESKPAEKLGGEEKKPEPKRVETPLKEVAPRREIKLEPKRVDAPSEEVAPRQEKKLEPKRVETPLKEVAPRQEIKPEPKRVETPLKEVASRQEIKPEPTRVDAPLDEVAPRQEIKPEPKRVDAPLDEVAPRQEIKPEPKRVETPLDEVAPRQEIKPEPKRVETPLKEVAPRQEIKPEPTRVDAPLDEVAPRREKKLKKVKHLEVPRNSIPTLETHLDSFRDELTEKRNNIFDIKEEDSHRRAILAASAVNKLKQEVTELKDTAEKLKDQIQKFESVAKAFNSVKADLPLPEQKIQVNIPPKAPTAPPIPGAPAAPPAPAAPSAPLAPKAPTAPQKPVKPLAKSKTTHLEAFKHYEPDEEVNELENKDYSTFINYYLEKKRLLSLIFPELLNKANVDKKKKISEEEFVIDNILLLDPLLLSEEQQYVRLSDDSLIQHAKDIVDIHLLQSEEAQKMLNEKNAAKEAVLLNVQTNREKDQKSDSNESKEVIKREAQIKDFVTLIKSHENTVKTLEGVEKKAKMALENKKKKSEVVKTLDRTLPEYSKAIKEMHDFEKEASEATDKLIKLKKTNEREEKKYRELKKELCTFAQLDSSTVNDHNDIIKKTNERIENLKSGKEMLPVKAPIKEKATKASPNLKREETQPRKNFGVQLKKSQPMRSEEEKRKIEKLIGIAATLTVSNSEAFKMFSNYIKACESRIEKNRGEFGTSIAKDEIKKLEEVLNSLKGIEGFRENTTDSENTQEVRGKYISKLSYGYISMSPGTKDPEGKTYEEYQSEFEKLFEYFALNPLTTEEKQL